MYIIYFSAAWRHGLHLDAFQKDAVKQLEEAGAKAVIECLGPTNVLAAERPKKKKQIMGG